LTMGLGLTLDLWSKSYAFRTLTYGAPERDNLTGHLRVDSDSYSLLPGWLHFKCTVNEGAVFGLGQGNQTLFMDPYVVFYPREKRNLSPSPIHGISSIPDSRWDNVRDTMGFIRSTGARGATLARARSATWPATISTCSIGHLRSPTR